MHDLEACASEKLSLGFERPTTLISLSFSTQTCLLLRWRKKSNATPGLHGVGHLSRFHSIIPHHKVESQHKNCLKQVSDILNPKTINLKS